MVQQVQQSVPSESPSSKKSSADYHERGREIYNFRCYFCHGYSGDAKTLAASYLSPKPRSFIATNPNALSRQQMINSVSQGRSGTAMKSFAAILTDFEIETVVDFVRQEFMLAKAPNTRYHTVENGWPNHQRYVSAYPFALGEITLDTPDKELSPGQRAGKQLFMTSCITCHDRGKVNDEGIIWDTRAVSYPRNQVTPKSLAQQLEQPAENSTGYGNSRASHSNNDSVTTATPYSIHDSAPVIDDLNQQQRHGETLFQKNCAFCHAADGTGKNWIGSFLEPHPRNLTDPVFMASMTRSRLRSVIEYGLPGTTMSAWKGVLTDEQIDSIIAYIDRAFHALQ